MLIFVFVVFLTFYLIFDFLLNFDINNKKKIIKSCQEFFVNRVNTISEHGISMIFYSKIASNSLNHVFYSVNVSY
jgi:hypothetical protein